MRVARWIYAIAGVVGIFLVAPMFFQEGQTAPDNPYPVMYYGFAQLALVWQVLFLVLATDPLRYRPMMPVTMLEKFGFVAVILWLYFSGRPTGSMWLSAAAVDGTLGVLFVVAYIATRGQAHEVGR